MPILIAKGGWGGQKSKNYDYVICEHSISKDVPGDMSARTGQVRSNKLRFAHYLPMIELNFDSNIYQIQCNYIFPIKSYIYIFIYI